MATIKIKQVKGQAGRPIDQKSTLESLGLGKINKVVGFRSSISPLMNSITSLCYYI